MAIDGAVHARSQFRLAIAEEATFGTAITTQADFTELHLTEPTEVDSSELLRDTTKRMDGSRIMTNTDIYVNNKGGTRMIPISGVATDNTLDLLIYAVMQNLSSEGASTPFRKTWTWNGSTTQPDFAADAGFTLTALGYDPETARHWSLPGCIVNSLTLNWDPTANGGRWLYSGTLWSGFTETYGSTATPASWTAPSTDYYGLPYSSTTVDSADVVPASYSVTFDNKAQRTGYDSNGDAQTYSLATDNEGYAATGTYVVKHDANTDDVIDTWQEDPTDGGDAGLIQIAFDTAADDTDGELSLVVQGAFDSQPNKDFGNDRGVFTNLPWRATNDSGTSAITVYISNAIDRAW